MQSNHQPDMTAAQAAELIGVTSQAVRDLIRAGQLPGARKISAAPNAPYLIPRKAVEAYLARRRASKKSE